MHMQKGFAGEFLVARGGRLLVLLFLLTVMLTSGTAAARNYKVGVVPQFSARALQSIWAPILQELENRTGHTFVLLGSQSISVFEEQFMAGEFDFAYMNPYHFIMAANSQGYVPLVRDTEKDLRGILVVRKDADVDDIMQLQGRSIAFPSPNALGASLMMRALLAREFQLDVEPKYVESHDSVYLNVVLGRTLAGGGVGRTLAKQPPRIRDQLRVLYTTPSVASHPFVAHPRVPEATRRQVQDVLIEMGGSDPGKALLAKIPIGSSGRATDEDYNSLRAMGLEAFYVGK